MSVVAEKFSGPIIGGPLDGKFMASDEPVEHIHAPPRIPDVVLYRWDEQDRVWRLEP
jgi:hypothetical protein